MTPPPPWGGWKWMGGLKGGWVGGSLPALEAPPPPPGSLSNSLVVRMVVGVWWVGWVSCEESGLVGEL